jgi:hypothetical protein
VTAFKTVKKGNNIRELRSLQDYAIPRTTLGDRLLKGIAVNRIA